MSGPIEIEAASLSQVRATVEDGLVLIDDDVQNVVRDLQEIDPGFRVHFDRDQEYFVVRHLHLSRSGEPEESLVTTARQLDQRIVERVRQISADGYDYGAELDRLDREADARNEAEFTERVAPIGEQLHHALRRDMHLDKDRAFIGDS